jgi:AcrR family transcriptional regulator
LTGVLAPPTVANRLVEENAVAQGRRRDAILSAARSEFARYGFAGARVERIADAADVNKQLIFHYFRSKEGLYSAAAAAVFANWQPAPDSGASPSERLSRMIAHLVEWLSDNPGAARAIAEAERGPGPSGGTPALPAAVIEWLAAVMGAVRSAVESGQQQGHFRDDADPQAVAEIAVSSAVGHALTPGTEGHTSPGESRYLAAHLSQALVEYCAWH